MTPRRGEARKGEWREGRAMGDTKGKGEVVGESRMRKGSKDNEEEIVR